MRIRRSDNLAQFLLLLLLISLAANSTACLGAPVEEEPKEVNLPHHISPSFISPEREVLFVESSDEFTIAVDQLFDPNDEEQLYYAVIGERSGLIEQATAAPYPTGGLYREAFKKFTGLEFTIDPCAQRLRDHSDEFIRLYVSDRPFQRVTEAVVEADDEGFLTTHRWLLRFNDQICS